jgi:hypothetical protein
MRAFGGTTAGVREDLKKEKHCTVYMTDRQREERKRERERERERQTSIRQCGIERKETGLIFI